VGWFFGFDEGRIVKAPFPEHGSDFLIGREITLVGLDDAALDQLYLVSIKVVTNLPHRISH
jgi:hypothetical protein